MESSNLLTKLAELGGRIKNHELKLGQIEAACVANGVMDPIPRGMVGMFEVALFRTLRWVHDLNVQWHGNLDPVKCFENDEFPGGLSAISVSEMVPRYGLELCNDENFRTYISLHYDNSGNAIKFGITEAGDKLVYGHGWDEIAEKVHAPALPMQRTPPPTPTVRERKRITPEPVSA